jgi:hypothetical protein
MIVDKFGYSVDREKLLSNMSLGMKNIEIY